MDKSRHYTSASLVRYDLAAREKGEVLGIDSFVYGVIPYLFGLRESQQKERRF